MPIFMSPLHTVLRSMSVFLVVIGLQLSSALPLQTALAEQCVVATVNPLASEAGANAFEAGGNAVDAAVAAALTLGVVDSNNSGIGGGCFILIRTPDGTLAAIDGREKAPAAATRDMFIRNGKAVPELSQTGPLASGVPGALAAYERAITEFGNRTLADVLRPAAQIADEGHPISRSLARNIRARRQTLARFPGSREIFLKEDGSPYREGEILRQADLARTYRMIADEGTDWFYQGEFAEMVADWMAENGGIVTADDFAAYRAVDREPVLTTYRDWQVVGFPPPSSGGIHVAQMLNMLEHFDLRQEYQQDPAGALHLIVETMKLAFADRAYWLGDADFVDVPRGLIDKDYTDSLAKRIDPRRSTRVVKHGTPPQVNESLFNRHTTHIAAADSEGYWVAITATVNTSFGSKVVVPGTGVVLNNEMDDFSAQPGVPNHFGLLGAENNAVEPEKRPLSSMSPTIVLDAEGQPVLTVGAAGGPKIITQVLLAVIRTLDLGYSLGDAVAAPRVHHQWMPNSVLVESSAPEEVIDQLEKLGHQVERINQSGVTQAIWVNGAGELEGVHDPRVNGKVALGKRG